MVVWASPPCGFGFVQCHRGQTEPSPPPPPGAGTAPGSKQGCDYPMEGKWCAGNSARPQGWEEQRRGREGGREGGQEAVREAAARPLLPGGAAGGGRQSPSPGSAWSRQRPSRALPSPGEPSRAEPSRAGPSRAGPGRGHGRRVVRGGGGRAARGAPRAAMGNISSNISAFQSLHIVMLGLDSAGKTTVLYRLKFNEFVNTVPTIGFNTEKIRLSNGTAKGISCHFWDVGGQEKLRPLWKSYSRCTDGIIYVVDSVDVDRLEEAKTELHKVTKFAENQGTPLLVIANKQDLPKSLPVAEIEKQLALHELTPSTTYHIQPACAIIGEGLTEGMDKLYEMILKRRKSLKQKKKR
ncbi:ADP-ribosylation factor-like protein 4C isoform X1 [Aix galericulata]|nr:ADP-ribosylation factor-like protein 4C isoform X1 [Aix galericulata]